MEKYVVSADRIQQMITELSQYGKNKDGGIDRSIGSKEDMQAREWLIVQCEKLGAKVRIDSIANIWAEINTASLEEKKNHRKPLTIGSHHDAVANGGKYDGAMGVILGLEVMRVIQENNIPLRHAYQVAMFTAEEPNPFNISTMGSRSVTGKITQEQLHQAESYVNHQKLEEAIQKVGGNINELEHCQLKKGDMSCFIECHIEQGKNLDRKQLSVATVKAITGIYREILTVHGEANHAGTTIMQDRKDALLAASEVALAVEKIIRSYERNDIVGTVGKFDILPNSVNIIPETAQFVMEIRIPQEDIKNEIVSRIAAELHKIEKARNLTIEREIFLDQSAVQMNEEIQKVLLQESAQYQKEEVQLVSMAGHDAVHMTDITKTAMLFVRSINGKSHCLEEYSRIEDIEVAGNVLLNTIIQLDQLLD